MLQLDKKLLLILAIVIIAFRESITAQCNGSVDLPADITICSPGNVTLPGVINGDYLFFEWTSDQGYQNDSELNPTVFVDETTTFNLSAQIIPLAGSNLITNGDFESGNTGFSTQYTYVANPAPMAIWAEGTYAVGTNPNSYHQNFHNCSDHTSGSGNMMIVNGSGSLSQIWCQTITVVPNTYYVFNAWATSVENASPAILQFAIDGTLIGSPLNLASSTCIWENFYAIWFSGTATSVEICVTDQNTQLSGNDFAIDDISFIKACEVEDEITVTVVEFEANIYGTDLINCADPTSFLIGEATPANPNYTYSWNSFDGNFSLGSIETEIVAESEGNYTLIVTDENNCTRSSDFVVYQDFELPEAELIVNDTLDCETSTVVINNLISQPNYFYVWSGPDNFYSDEKDAIATEPGLYTVTVTNSQNSCEEIYEIEVHIDESLPQLSLLSSGNLTCNVDTISLTANNPDYSYTWSGPGISGYVGAKVDVNQIGTYSVVATDNNGCTTKNSIEVIQTPPLINLIPALQDTLTCINVSIQINTVIGGTIDSVYWQGVDSIYSNVLSPYVSESGQYIMTAFDANGCVLKDTVYINDDLSVPLPDNTSRPIDCVTKTGSFVVNHVEGVDSIFNITSDISLNFDQDFIVVNSGIYRIKIIADNGCKDTISVVVNKNEDYPNNVIDVSPINCINTISDFTVVTNIDSVTYQWNNDAGFISSNQNISVTDAGEYYLKSTSNLGCESFDTVMVSIDTIIPVFNFIADDVNCFSPFSIPNLINSDNNLNFTWNGPNVNNFNGIPTQLNEGIYDIWAEGENGCLSQKRLTINKDERLPIATITGIDTLNCKITNLDITCNSPTGIVIDKWIGNGLTITDSLAASINQQGVFSIIGHHPISGCADTFQFDIPQDLTKPSLVINGDSLLNCKNLELNKTATIIPATSSINWKNSVGNIIGQSRNIQLNDAGDFIVEAIHPTTFCKEELVFNIKIDTIKPVFMVEHDSINCYVNRATIKINTSNENEITFSNNDVIQSSNNLFTTKQAGKKQINVKGENGCSAIKEINIEVDTIKPEGNINFTNIDCRAIPASIIANTFPTIDYKLTKNNKLVTIDKNYEVSVAGKYNAEFFNEMNGCKTIVDFEILKIDNAPYGLSFDIPFSCDIYAESFLFDGVDYANGNYNVYVDNLELTNTNSSITLTPGQHSLKLIDALGCEVDTLFSINTYEIPTISEDINLEINFGEEVQFEVNTSIRDLNMNNINWVPNDYLSCNDCLNPICTTPQNILYTLTIEDENGCSLQSSIRVDVKYNVEVLFPNIIRLGSGINESFYPSANPYVESIDYMRIYDRWGNLVFDNEEFLPNDQSHGWKGKFNNTEVSAGVYVYVCRAKTVKGDLLDFVGDVTVVK